MRTAAAGVSATSDAASIARFAVLGQAVILALTATLANTMTPDAFEAYAAASAAFIVAVKLAPLGVEALSLRVLPPALRAGDEAMVRGYLRFAIRRAAQGSLLVAGFAILWFSFQNTSPELRSAVAVGSIAVPLGVVAHLGFDVLTAAGRGRTSAIQLRLVVPAVALGLVLFALFAGIEPTGALAVAAWTAGWATVVALQFNALARLVPRAWWSGRAQCDRAQWKRMARPFYLYQAATGALAQAAIIALVALDTRPEAVGAYVAAATCVSAIVLIGAAANRLYARELSLCIDQGQWTAISALNARRLRGLAPAIGVALTVCLLLPSQVLDLFRPGFGDEGSTVLRLLAVSAVVTLAFALAPTYLKQRDRGGVVLGATLAAATLQLVLLLKLVPAQGAVGAAVAHSITSALLYALLAWIARADRARKLRQKMSSGCR